MQTRIYIANRTTSCGENRTTVGDPTAREEAEKEKMMMIVMDGAERSRRAGTE